MTAGPSPSSSSPAPAVASKTKTGRMSKDAQFEEVGRRIKELAKKHDKYITIIPSLVYDSTRKLSLGRRKTESLKQELVDKIKSLLEVDALDEIRMYVSAAETRPIDTKYVGRALRELAAFGETTAKTRINVFAFFYDSPQCEVVKNTASVDYWACAEECYLHENKLLKVKRIHGNKVSECLETPVIRLEQLRLVLSNMKAVTPAASKSAKKREGSYLTPIGVDVFSGWPEWPAASPTP